VVPPPESPDDDDVVDPYRQSDDVYRQSADQLVPAVTTVLAQFAAAAVLP
jgi:protein-tyrosine phosphatase